MKVIAIFFISCSAVVYPVHGQTAAQAAAATQPDSIILPATATTSQADTRPTQLEWESTMAGTVQVVSSFPNPFTTTTRITFKLDAPEMVTLRIYNSAGELVKDIYTRQSLPEGLHSAIFDASSLPKGMYFPVLATSRGTWTNNMLRLD